MKYASSFALLSSVVFASPMPQSQDLGSAVTDVMNKGYGRVADVPGATARRQVLESRAKHIDGATTVKVRYGPYKIPSCKLHMVETFSTIFTGTSRSDKHSGRSRHTLQLSRFGRRKTMWRLRSGWHECWSRIPRRKGCKHQGRAMASSCKKSL